VLIPVSVPCLMLRFTWTRNGFARSFRAGFGGFPAPLPFLTIRSFAFAPPQVPQHPDACAPALLAAHTATRPPVVADPLGFGKYWTSAQSGSTVETLTNETTAPLSCLSALNSFR